MSTSNAKRIKHLMVDADLTGGVIARNIGVTRQSINLAIRGEIKSPRLRKVIAKALGKKVIDLWPDSANETPQRGRPAKAATIKRRHTT
jgi:DNA-binding XRE family transcriptional regulator